MPETQHLASPAMLCQQTGRSYPDLLKTLSNAGVRPALTLDLVPYFDWNQATRAIEVHTPKARSNGS
jgi:hypothetical protein